MGWSRRPSARFRVRDRVVTDPVTLPHPLDRYLDSGFPRRRGAEDRPPQGGALAGAHGEGDTSGWAPRTRRGLVVSYIQSLYWEFGSGCVLPRDRRADAEPRRELFARPRRAQSARARPPAVPHAQSGARRAQATDASWPTAPWAATASRRRRPRVFTRHVTSGSRSSRRSTRRAGCSGRTWGSTHTNLRLESRFDGDLIDRLMSAGHDVEVLPEPYSDSWGTRAPWCCIRDGTWKARTIRAPMAAPPACEQTAAIPF